MKRAGTTFSMLRLIKFGWLAALLLGFQSAFGFALLGPVVLGLKGRDWPTAPAAPAVPPSLAGRHRSTLSRGHRCRFYPHRTVRSSGGWG